MRCHRLLTDRLLNKSRWKKKILLTIGVSAKGEPIAPRADLSA
jgi:hypothetical protein